MFPGKFTMEIGKLPHKGRVLKFDRKLGIGYVAELNSPNETIGAVMKRAETMRPFVFSVRDVMMPGAGADGGRDIALVDGAKVSFDCDDLGRIVKLAVVDG